MSAALHCDVAVVGAGPAGTAAALALARTGRDVVLVDKARFPRDKCCGDGLTALALRRLEALGIEPAAVRSWQPVNDVVVRSPSGRQVTFPLPRTQGQFAAVARRIDLDAALVDAACAAGAKLLDGHACTGAREREDRVELDIDGVGEVDARYVVAADGMWSPVRRHLGLATPGYRGEWHAFRQYFAAVSAPAARDLLVWFEPDLLPGYAWSFPLPDGRANVGFGIQRGGKVGRIQDMASLWPDLLGRPHIAAALGPGARPEAPHKAWPIPARVDAACLATRRVLIAGDAAGACDPMTGEGIGQALETGMLAADAITAGGPFDAATVAARYESRVRAALVADHRMSMLLIRGLRHRKGARAAVRVAGLTDWTRRSFARWLLEDEPRAIAMTPRRWHAQPLARAGAFRSST